MSPFSWQKRFPGLDSVHVSLWIGLGGIAFMAGNLLLAGALTPEHFGRLTLYQALLGLSAGVAPLGLDSLVVRREIGYGKESVALASGAGAMTASLTAVLAAVLFQFDAGSVGLIVAAVLFAGVARLCAASEQAVLRLTRSQILTQLPFLSFGIGAGVLVMVEVRDWRWAALVLVIGHALAAAVGLAVAKTEFRGSEERVRRRLSRSAAVKGLSFVGILASVLALHQMERLVIPVSLGLEALGTFAVVATVVASPYRVLHGGIGFALMPRILAQREVAGRARLVRTEMLLVVALGVGGGVVLALVTRPLIQALYGDKYEVAQSLVVAIAIVGIIRLIYGVLAAVVSAVGDRHQLHRFNAFGWVATATAAAAAFLLSKYGLVGVVVGVALGWILRSVVVFVLARSALASSDAPTGPASVQ